MESGFRPVTAGMPLVDELFRRGSPFSTPLRMDRSSPASTPTGACDLPRSLSLDMLPDPYPGMDNIMSRSRTSTPGPQPPRSHTSTPLEAADGFHEPPPRSHSSTPLQVIYHLQLGEKRRRVEEDMTMADDQSLIPLPPPPPPMLSGSGDGSNNFNGSSSFMPGTPPSSSSARKGRLRKRTPSERSETRCEERIDNEPRNEPADQATPPSPSPSI